MSLKYKTVDDSRRKALFSLASTIAALPLLPHFLYAESSSVSALSLPENDMANFMALSSILTDGTTLDAETGSKIMHKLQQEPWGKEHLHRVLQKFAIGESEQPTKEAAFANLDQGEHWFVGHLLTTWMTGIYFHESGNEVLSYSHALMYASFRGIYPEPYKCDSDFAYWQKTPSFS